MIRRHPKFKYTLPRRNGHGFCSLNVLSEKRGVATVFLQAGDFRNFQSPTNCIEHIADQICERFEIKPAGLTLIEGPYPQVRRKDNGREWMLVTFKRRGDRFVEPRWTPLSSDDWASLYANATGAKFR